MQMNELWTIEELRNASLPGAAIWAIPAVRQLTSEALPYPCLTLGVALPDWCSTLIAVGGGTLIDESKTLRRQAKGTLRLIAVPSIWGSGAERSRIAVLNRNGKKEITVDAANLPDIYVLWQDLAKRVSDDRAKFASGDVWAHAAEAFCSPLATRELRSECAGLLRAMYEMPFTYDHRWLELSGAACLCQSLSSVGLIHGIAHTLEIALKERFPEEDWHHARLCSLFLWPVMMFNSHFSPKLNTNFSEFDLPGEGLLQKMRQLLVPGDYHKLLPVLKESWSQVLRDPCTRTNSVLVRATSISFFETLTI